MKQIAKKLMFDVRIAKHDAMFSNLPLARSAPKTIADFGRVAMGGRGPSLPPARPKFSNR